VPTVVASPFTRGNPASPRVVDAVFDHTSALKLIEWRWGLPPLTPRDASSDVGNLAAALDFSSPITAVPPLPKPSAPLPVPCLTLAPLHGAGDGLSAIGKLAKSELMKGWKLP
jgi:phospholipase C